MRQIIESTDGNFIGKLFDEGEQIILNGVEFIPDQILDLKNGIIRYFNSNYVIDTKKEE